MLLMVAAAAVFALIFAFGLSNAPPARAAGGAAPLAFAGASEARVFLSPSEQVEAAMRGLLPKGTRSILRTHGPMAHGQWHWDDQGVPRGKLTVRVDPSRQLLSVFRGPHEIGTAVILYGAKGKETPRGRLPIIGKTRDHHSRTYDAPMPYSLWLTTDGVAIHGSSVTMGRASNGCIGVPVPFAAKLFNAAKKGDVVEVLS
ncbi:L,D-transpeptidase family protein [Qipengyuania sediminis]|uniref:L,D-transpeptidase family protein n=1 Tax=Qipengyuania sediminis TaxID=1532023 RepID=UPI001981A88F|nr:L,D-transpeptidase family protein [Qipengyuania sediminis]